MKTERTSYREWPQAYRCTVGPLELIVVTSIGPRIMSLRFDGGENLLYEDATDFGVGAWRLYGGHRFTVAPEGPASYTPDNGTCPVEVKDDRLRLCSPTSGGLQRSLEIGPGPGNAGFGIRHILRNVGATPWRGAPWAITCVPTQGRLVVPEPGKPLRFWSQPGEPYAGASSPQWRSAQDHFVVEPNGEKGKVGLVSERGWLALLRPDVAFVVRGPARAPGAAYPDDGCNVEVFTCADYLELETLGPLATLFLGEEIVHGQQWQVIPRSFTPEAWRTLAESTHPLIPPSVPLVCA